MAAARTVICVEYRFVVWGYGHARSALIRNGVHRDDLGDVVYALDPQFFPLYADAWMVLVTTESKALRKAARDDMAVRGFGRFTE